MAQSSPKPSAGAGPPADSPVVVAMQKKLNLTLSVEDPAKIFMVLEESHDLGEAVKIERDALQERFDTIIKGAVDEMTSAKVQRRA